MRKCPKCNSIQYPEHIQNCLVCGEPLLQSRHEEKDDEEVISLFIDFTIITCEECGLVYPYTTNEMACSNCGEPFTNDDGTVFVSEILDPIVSQRRSLLKPLQEMRNSILTELQGIAPMLSELAENDYRLKFIEYSREYVDRAEDLRQLLSTTDFHSNSIISDGFSTQINILENYYKLLFEIAKGILTLSPPQTWRTLHKAFLTSTKKSFQSYLDIIDVLQVEDFAHAQDLMSKINDQLKKAGQAMEEIRGIATAGKKLRYGQASNLPEAIATLADEDTDISSWQNKGWNYFKDIFSRNISEIPQEYGFHFAMCAIVAESFNSPSLLKSRASAISNLLRQADVSSRALLQAVTSQVDADVLHASRLLFDIGLQFLVTDFSRLHPQQKFNMAIHAYQRMSEGSFKHLLNILLFSERLVEGENPNYGDISRRNFGPKVKRHNSRNPKSIADSSDPIIAKLADDLVMYVRHADAHCDFRAQEDKIIVNERDHRTKTITTIHEYSEEEFFELIQRLLEAVFAIMVGILNFQIEHYEDYLTVDSSLLFDYEKFELCKNIFAVKGIVVDSMELVPTESINPDLKIYASLSERGSLTPFIFGPPFAATVATFPDVRFLVTELHNNNEYLGTLTVPSSHFQRYHGSQRHKQLVVLDLTYKLLTKYADPSNLFNIEMPEDELYYWYLFKGAILYLNHILVDCYKIVKTEVSPTREQVKSLDQELTTLQNILVANPPPKSYHLQYSHIMQAARIGKQFIRARQLFMRPKAKRKPKDFKAILGRAEPIRRDLLDFVIAKEKEKERQAKPNSA